MVNRVSSDNNNASTRSTPLSILDLAIVGRNSTAREAIEGSVKLAQLAETRGYNRVWYAEHHNIPSIASSATSVLIAHVAANTKTIRVGAGGIMLPNHAPLVIAEQFGTLETLHPGRIDLGLGRAPGTDQNTLRALRRDARASETFPQDIEELQGFLSGHSRIPGVNANPGMGTNVPLYILGSSLFGSTLAAAMGLPYAFASHFSPAALQDAVAAYRRGFKPSEQLQQPYVIAAVNVIAADTHAEAHEIFRAVLRMRVALMSGAGPDCTDEQADAILQSPQGQQIAQMLRYSAVGTPDEVKAHLAAFTEHADADELMVVHQSTGTAERLRSVELLSDAYELSPAAPN